MAEKIGFDRLPSTLRTWPSALFRPIVAVVLLAFVLGGCDGDGGSSDSSPNILLVVMDDVGIDQMAIFGYGGETAPRTPNIDSLAHAGIRFDNAWSMPACTTTRGSMFDGRYPFRTDVLGALGPDDLANSMVSPYELTTPKLLAEKGYESALFGKFHIALQGNNPAGLGMVHDLGWDYYEGWLDETGDPSSIDTTAGGVAPENTWPCGFVGSAAQGGADAGACYQPDGDCTILATVDGIPPGRTCRDDGGIFDPNKTCQSPAPSYLNFQTLSAHYVGPLVINHENGDVEEVPPTDPRARRFRAGADVDNAARWINDRRAGQSWMATLSFASAHTPLMQPPPADLSSGAAATSDLDCRDTMAGRELMNQMVESLDTQLARLLVETGLAVREPDGSLSYRLVENNTVLILLGDNGSLGSTVKMPFDGSRAKGTTYQAGVWVPLIVTGAMVNGPDRVVPHMINTTDLYQLFGELAGIDVHSASPRLLDSLPVLPYLTNPAQPSIRTYNFTQIGTNLQANGAVNSPCVIGTTCTQIPVTKGVCEDNGGIWWGNMADDPSLPPLPEGGLPNCCDVNALLANGAPEGPLSATPLSALAIRNGRYKLVQNLSLVYGSPDQPCVEQPTTEFYEVNQAVPVPLLDDADKVLDPNDLSAEQQESYVQLSAQLSALLASEVPCPGDGNADGVVDQQDLDEWSNYSGEDYGRSSVYDLDLDGFTDTDDEAIIRAHLGTTCGAD